MTPPTWTPETRPLRRVFTAVASPQVTGTVVLVCAIVIAVLIVVLRPHEAAVSDVDLARGERQEQATEFLGAIEADAEHAIVVVHVTGSVHNPGVIELTDGARVGDAVDAAGGALEDAGLDAVNLARALIDGEHIHVPNGSEVTVYEGGHGRPGVSGEAKVQLNHAGATELEQLPGIGPALAQRIVDWRHTHGGFAQVEDLLQVSGIGPKVFEGLSDLVTAP